MFLISVQNAFGDEERKTLCKEGRGSLYNFSLEDLKTEIPMPLSTLHGKVVLLVNVASF